MEEPLKPLIIAVTCVGSLPKKVTTLELNECLIKPSSIWSSLVTLKAKN